MEEIKENNLISLLNYHFTTGYNLDNIISYYNPDEGHIYCLHNNIYKYYGDNVYKCGNTSDMNKRIVSYTTSYIEKSNVVLLSDKYIDKNIAELLLFNYLKEYRLKSNREFFDCNIDIIKDAFIKIDNIFNTYNNKTLLINYLITSNLISKVQIKNNIFIDKNEKFKEELIKIINNNENKDNETEYYLNYKLKFIKFWKLKELNEYDINMYLNCEHKLNRLLILLNNIENKYNVNDYIDEKTHDDPNLNNKIDVINNIINTLEFDLNNLDKKISRESYYENVKKLLNDNNFFKKDYNNNRILFNKDKHILNDKIKGSALSKLLNGFLEEFGLIIEYKHSTKKINNKTEVVYFYKIGIINKYLKYINKK
jgi:hypothetical protein